MPLHTPVQIVGISNSPVGTITGVERDKKLYEVKFAPNDFYEYPFGKVRKAAAHIPLHTPVQIVGISNSPVGTITGVDFEKRRYEVKFAPKDFYEYPFGKVRRA